jgi:acyl-CoA thioesterase-1
VILRAIEIAVLYLSISNVLLGRECLRVVPPTTHPQAEGRRAAVLVVGSSTAEGAGASRYSNSWAGRLQSALTPLGVEVVNASVPAFGTEQMKVILERRLADVRPRVVVMAVNIYNEAIVERPGRAVSTFQRNTLEMLGMIESSGATAVLTLMIPNRRYDPSVVREVRMTNNWIESLGRQTIDFWGPLADLDGLWLPGMTVDGTHPTDLGHRVMFDAIDTSMIQRWSSFEQKQVVKACIAEENVVGWYSSPGSDAWVALIPAQPVRSWHLRIESDPPFGTNFGVGIREGDVVSWYSRGGDEWLEQLILRCNDGSCALLVDGVSLVVVPAGTWSTDGVTLDISYQDVSGALAIFVTQRDNTVVSQVNIPRLLAPISGMRIRSACDGCSLSNVTLHRTPRLSLEDRGSYLRGFISFASLLAWSPFSRVDFENGLTNRVFGGAVIGATGDWTHGSPRQ